MAPNTKKTQKVTRCHSHQRNKCIFSARRNCLRERSGFRSFAGKLFCSRCPAAAKAKSPWCVVVCCNTHMDLSLTVKMDGECCQWVAAVWPSNKKKLDKDCSPHAWIHTACSWVEHWTSRMPQHLPAKLLPPTVLVIVINAVLMFPYFCVLFLLLSLFFKYICIFCIVKCVHVP